MRRVRRPWWQTRVGAGGAAIGLIVLVTILAVLLSNRGSSGDSHIGAIAPADLVQNVAHSSAAVNSAVGAGKQADGTALPPPLRALTGAALTDRGKPEVLFIGGEYCSHCAGLRWSVINALGRFGTFAGLQYMRTSAAYDDLVTLDFYQSSYTSPYLSFVPVENSDRDAKQLQPMTGEQQSLLSTINGDSYPLVDIAGLYANDVHGTYGGAGFDAGLLAGKDWSQVAAGLSNPSDPLTQGIVSNANYITAAICKATHDRPASACGTATIEGLERQLPQA